MTSFYLFTVGCLFRFYKAFCGMLLLWCSLTVHAQTGDIAATVKTALGETIPSESVMSGTISGNGNVYNVSIDALGSLEVLGIPSAIDAIGNRAIGVFTDDGPNAAINVCGYLSKALDHSNIFVARYSSNGKKRQVHEFSYNPATGATQVYANCSSNNPGLELLLIEDGKGNRYTTKAINIPSGDASKKSFNLDNITNQPRAQLKSSAPTGPLLANSNDWSYTLNLVDQAGHLKPITIPNISVKDNQVTNLGNIVTEYANTISGIFAVQRNDQRYINNVPIILSYDGVPLDLEQVTSDTIWITEGYKITDFKTNVYGRNPKVTIPNGFEDDTMVNPSIPFKTTSTTMSIDLEQLQDQEFVPEVDKYQDQAIHYDYKNDKSILHNDIKKVKNIPITVTYISDGMRVETYTTNDDGIITLDRMPEGSTYGISVPGGTYPTGDSNELKEYYGKGVSEYAYTYDLVKTESEEERTISGVLYEVRTTAAGERLQTQEIGEMNPGPFLQAATGLIRFKVSDEYLEKVPREIFRGYLDIVENVFGTRPDGSKRLEYQIVDENLNPDIVDFQINYDFATNNYKNELTSTWAGGSPETKYNEVIVNISTAHNKKQPLNMYSNVTCTSGRGEIFKEIGRNNLSQSDRDTSFMSVSGSGSPDEKDYIIAPLIFDANQNFFDGTDYESLKFLTKFN